jgi:Flp pilus assembly pilin Flp
MNKRCSGEDWGLGKFRRERATMKPLVDEWLHDECGQDLIEYAMLAGFISLIAILAITSIGTTVDSWYVGYDATIKTIPSGSGS